MSPKLKKGFLEGENRIIVTAAYMIHGERFCAEHKLHPRDPKVLIVTPESCHKLRGIRLHEGDRVLHSPTMHIYEGPHYKVQQLNEQIKCLLSNIQKKV